MKSVKGFTLVELIIVIVIVGILSIVAVPVYKGYTKKAMGTEAKALLGAIATAERVHFAEFNRFYIPSSDRVGYDKTLDVDARSNKYFPVYEIKALNSNPEEGFVATVKGIKDSGAERIVLTLTFEDGKEPTLTEEYDAEEKSTWTRVTTENEEGSSGTGSGD